MIEEIILASPMAVVVIGAFILLLISHSKRFNLDRLNLIAVMFLSVSFVLQSLILDSESKFLFSNVFGNTFILDEFAKIFDFMFTIGAILNASY